MQPVDLDLDAGANANFWEPHQYSRTVKRAENANKLCSEFVLMIQERADIEKAYASNLRKFAARLEMFLRTGVEYGTATNILSGLAKEAEDNAELHSNIAAGLINPVQLGIKNWQRENFHKSSISTSIKEVKNFDSEFENAQKTWYKHYKNVNRCKKEYFHACKTVRSLQVQVQNAKNEPFGTPEQQAQRGKELRKIEDKLRKGIMEEEKTRKAYEEALSSLSDVTPRYIEDMTQVFNKAQAFERERIIYFKEQALQMQEVLDISAKPNLSQIFVGLRETVAKVDADADLKKWSLAYGVDMAPNFPVFQEYSPEMSALGKKGRSALADGSSGGVTLTSLKTITSPDRGGPIPGTTDSGSNISTSPVHTTAYGSNSYDHGSEGATPRNLKLWTGLKIFSQAWKLIMTSNGSIAEAPSTNLDEPSESPKLSDPPTSDIDQADITKEHLIVPTTAESCRPVEVDNLSNFSKRKRSPSSVQSVEEQAGEAKKAELAEDEVDTEEKAASAAEESQKLVTDDYTSSVNGAAAAISKEKQRVEDTPPYPDFVDDGRPGVPIRALYDYVGVEADELSFNSGDLFEKLEDEDEQGWCKGRKDGRVGLYPANYVEIASVLARVLTPPQPPTPCDCDVPSFPLLLSPSSSHSNVRRIHEKSARQTGGPVSIPLPIPLPPILFIFLLVVLIPLPPLSTAHFFQPHSTTLRCH
ncbi:protein kinase C and casein kinase substrate in [Echinococcus multilocularis]|uniref:Protein kinase C and casein kinase substrate in n=1 Tax=Echinococcus multilocularis TaxID=6211 RepID=A0A068YEH2_ECHMU|nr:protein kinase C and casein kinase substrate in [Echinococcus multilocularis]